MSLHSYAVIDFETTGLSPAHGARPTEIAVVLVRGGEIVDRFQSLMNPGVRIPYENQTFTGITDAMVRRAPPVRQVMADAVRFAGGHPIVAHNASFDRKFWERETAAMQGKVVDKAGSDGRFHRALADAECTAHLFIRLQQEIVRVFGVPECDCGLMQRMQAANRHQLDKCVRKYVEGLAG